MEISALFDGDGNGPPRTVEETVPVVVRNKSTAPAKAPRKRLAGFAMAVLVGGLAIGWINTNVRQRMADLERDFGTIRTERFYQAIQVRQTVLRLNELLLEYQVTGQRLPLVRFRDESAALESSIATRQQEAAAEDEAALLRRLADAFQNYQNQSISLHERQGFFTSNRKRVDETNEELRRISDPVLGICELLMQFQRSAFGSFLETSQQTLESLQHLIQLSLVMLFVLALAVAVLVYRGMIAPLQVQLSESQAIIARQEKLAALGGLAAGVAHEIRNPLTAIKFRLFSLKKSLPSGWDDNEDAAVIAGEISRLERIVRDFLEFARPSDPEATLVPARQLLDEVSHLMRPQLEEAGIELKVAEANGLWLNVDFQQIKQVLINLIRNGAESIEAPGAIHLRAFTDTGVLAGRKLPVSVIEVADTGRGIPPEAGPRLFDPFFTTKEGGTGLGLSIAARIVEKHDGELQFESRPGNGTTFKLVLPRSPEDESENPAH